MEITKENFEIIEPNITNDILESDFISLDLELTGISPWNNNILDYPEERFLKYKQVAEKFRIIQVGLCTFKHNDDMTYIAKPYNFYVFPEDNTGNNLLICETSAIIFNRDHKMDFNKWIYSGIPYINAKQEKSMFDALADTNINLYDPSDISKIKNISLHKDEDKTKFEEFQNMFVEFINSDIKTYMFEKYPRYFFYHIMNNLHSDIRKKIYFSYQMIEGKNYLLATKVDEEEKKKMLEKELGNKLNDLHVKKGFRRIFEAMLKRKANFVGHNCIADLLFIISHFGDQLPNSLSETKNLMKNYFNEIYDTKYMYDNYCLVNDIKSDNNNLEKIYCSLKQNYGEKINISIPDGFPNYTQDCSIYHQAGFDAYVTGASYIYMKESHNQIQKNSHNKIYLMRSVYHCFNLNGIDPYVCPNTNAYCLKAIKQINDIDLKSILDEHLYIRIKKIYNVDTNNALLILVECDSDELLNVFEQTINKFTHIFIAYSLHKYKEHIKEEEEKRNDSRKHKNKS